IVYLENPSERDFFVASVADKIFMNPSATISLNRFQAHLTYLAASLKKVGVKAEAITAGKYKSAPRRWTHENPQKEEIDIASNILNSFYDAFIDHVSESRNIEKDQLKKILDSGEITSQEAKDFGLIDGAIYKDQLQQVLLNQENVTLPVWSDYSQRTLKNYSWEVKKKIVVIPIEGEIVDGRVGPSLLSVLSEKTGSQDVIEKIENAVSDPNVVGIIVRINSVGGDANAGDKIHRALSKAQKIVPVVASMSDVAASAAYMIAAGTQYIIAEPNTVTGSIGVFSLYFSGNQLAKKIGVHDAEISPIKNPGPNRFRSMTRNERAQAQKIVDWYYQNFIDRVSSGLNLDAKTVEAHAQGRVWLGHEALERKLIHKLGGFMDAVDALWLLAQLKDDQKVDLEISIPGAQQNFSLLPPFSSLFGRQNYSDEHLEKILSPYVKILDLYKNNGSVQARIPFDIDY
ncbi:MAG: S49 family peptidase, partial [Myxococcales bacterium]|nr:S49 family peptidase [Myxococcales bacterium]